MYHGTDMRKLYARVKCFRRSVESNQSCQSNDNGEDVRNARSYGVYRIRGGYLLKAILGTITLAGGMEVNEKGSLHLTMRSVKMSADYIRAHTTTSQQLVEEVSKTKIRKGLFEIVRDRCYGRACQTSQNRGATQTIQSTRA